MQRVLGLPIAILFLGAACHAEPELDTVFSDQGAYAEVTAKYGVSPLSFDTYLSGGWPFAEGSGGDRAFACFTAALDEANVGVNSVSPVAVTRTEIAVNFLMEGANLALQDMVEKFAKDASATCQDSQFDAFGYFGLDKIVSDFETYAPYIAAEKLRDEVIACGCADVKSTSELCAQPSYGGPIGDGKQGRCDSTRNEQNQLVHFLSPLTVREGMMISAAIFANRRNLFQRDLIEVHPTVDAAALPPEGRFFWATLYFNLMHAPGQARAYLDGTATDPAGGQPNTAGAYYYQIPWTRSDDYFEWSMFSQYNALKRTATFEYVSRVRGEI